MATMQTLAWAHHDGSGLYAPDRRVDLGETVTLRVRTDESAGVDRVWLRTVRDGEPHHVEATPDGTRDGERWFAVDLELHNPLTGYRFLLERGGDTVRLDGAGLTRREGTDERDFRLNVADQAPDWLRDALVYQIFPDRFAPEPDGSLPAPLPDWAERRPWDAEPASHGSAMGREVFGGTLGGIESRLDHLTGLGVTALYLTPFFPGRSNHRYDASTFDHVDPLLGGDAALARLTAAAHARGLRVMGDLTTNHTGAGHEWFAASKDPESPESAHYLWNGSRDDWVGWLGHRALPKLDWRDQRLIERMVTDEGSAVRRWLAAPYGLDGWRIDVANMTGRHRDVDVNALVAGAVRAAATATRPDAAVVAEHFHDATHDLRRGDWDATMNYAGFLRPVWQWLARPGGTTRWLEAPYPIPSRTGEETAGAMRDVLAATPWRVAARAWNLLSTHDTARFRTVAGSAERHHVAAVMLYTYPGAPFVFAGDEGGLTAVNGEHARTPMPWNAIDHGGAAWDAETHELYRALGTMRRDACALRHGGLRWALVDDDAMVYLRECAHERIAVLVARGPVAARDVRLGGPVSLLEPLAGTGAGVDVRLSAGAATLSAEGPSAQVWRMHR